MNLLLVDDHALFREGLELVLRHLDATTQVRHAAHIADALREAARPPAVDLVLLDLHLPGTQGLDALYMMRAHAEATPVVVLSGSEDLKVVWQAIDAGAMGFIQKQSDSRTMMQALRVVLGGGIYLPPICLSAGTDRSPVVAAAPPRDLATATPAPTRERLQELGISERQLQVVAKMIQGKSNKVIGRELGITDATVKTHLSAVFAALGAHSRTEAVYTLARLGLRLQDLAE